MVIEVFLHPFLTSAQDGHKWLASNPWGNSPGTPWIRGWVGSRASMDILEKRAMFCPCQDSYPGSSNLQPSHYTDYTMQVLMFQNKLPNDGSRRTAWNVISIVPYHITSHPRRWSFLGTITQQRKASISFMSIHLPIYLSVHLLACNSVAKGMWYWGLLWKCLQNSKFC